MKFHHMSLCKTVPTHQGKVCLDPSFWNEVDGGLTALQYSDCLESASGESLDLSTDFIVKNKRVLPVLAEQDFFIFFVLCDAQYLKDMPVFFSDNWDGNLGSNDLTSLGWSVYAFSEPAVLYGSYPGNSQENGLIWDVGSLNKWGLIGDLHYANCIAKTNNSQLDENSGCWRVLEICAFKLSMPKLNASLVV